ncbi:MAG: LamG domain-containing protein [Candidatus Woesearchaeota archaeon]
MPVNESFPTVVNYTVYANDTAGNLANISGNFTVNHNPVVQNVNITPYELFTTSYPSAIWNYSDVDGDAQNKSIYTWYLNGTEAWKDPSLIAYYKMDNFQDSIGSNILSSAINISNISGKIKGTLGFEGNTSEISTSLNTIVFTNNLSISFWMNAHNKSYMNSAIFTHKTASFLLAYFTTGNKIAFYPRSSYNLNSATTLQQEQWYHVTLIVSSYNATHNNATIYLNGAFDATGIFQASQNASTAGITFGRYTTRYYNGSLDEFKIWNRSLTAQEIKQEYEMMDYGEVQNPPVMQLHFEEESGNESYNAMTLQNVSFYGGVNRVDSGKFGKAISLDSNANTYVYFNNNFQSNISKEGSFSIWVNPTNIPGDSLYHQLVKFYFTQGSWLFSKGYDDSTAPNTLYWYETITGSNNIQASSSKLLAGNWTNVVYTWKNNDYVRIYVNGNYVDKSWAVLNSSLRRTLNYIRIGLRWNGSMDEFVLYDHALSSTEINDLYNLSRPLYSLDESVINKGTNVTLQIEPNDNVQFGTAVNSTTLTVQDTTPTANNVTIKPLSINNTVATVSATWDYTDADGHRENASVYEWYINGTNAWPDLIGYYKMDNSPVNAINGNSGTIYNSISNATGKIKGAYQWGSLATGYIQDVNSVNFSKFEWSVTAWVKLPPTSALSYQTLFSPNGYPYIKVSHGTYPLLYLNAGANDYYRYGNVDIKDNQWHHIAFLFRDSDHYVKIYVDGIDRTGIGPNGNVPNTSNNNWMIGGVNGTVDELMIWNRTLSVQEVIDLYNMTFYGQIDHTAANHTIPNVTLNYYMSPGTNLTFGVTPYNGLVYGNQSNSTTLMVYDVISPNITIVNITDLTGLAIDATNLAETDENTTLYINITSDSAISRAWIVIWQTIASAGNIFWQGFLSLLSGTIWSVQLPVNESFARITNYTVYANDTWGNTINISSNFTVNHNPIVQNVNITPYELFTTSYPSAMWNYSDVDGDAQNKSVYTWYINGTEAWKDNSLLGYWKLDGNGIDSHNDNNGDVLGDSANISGVIRGAYTFDGEGDDYINITSWDETQLNETATFSAWIKVNGNTPTDMGIVGSTYGDDYNWVLRVDSSNRLALRGWSGTAATATSTKVLPLRTWVHVAVTFDKPSNSIKYYVDGQYSDSDTISFNGLYNGFNKNLQIGYYSYLSKSFNGSIDEVKIWNRSLTAQEVEQEYEMMKYGEARDPPVTLWHMDEGQGNAVKDAVGGIDGTRMKHANWTNASKWNTALAFDGTDDYITVPYTTRLAPTSAITVSAWFNSRDITKDTRILSKTQSGGYYIALNDAFGSYPSNTLGFSANINGTYRAAYYPVSNLSNGVWYYVVGTFNGSALNLYLNGVLVNNYTGAVGSIITYSANNPLCIGSEPDTSVCTVGSYFNGTIDEVSIYNRALSATEINDLYNLSRPLYSLDESIINKGTNVSLMIEPNDDKQFGTAQNSTTLTVQDTSPTANNVTIKPRAINNTVTSVAGTWDYADADNEPENASVYEWYINGTNAWREGLIGYWDLDGNTNNSISLNMQGAISNSNYIKGRIRQGMNFSGDSNSAVIVQDFNMTENITIAGWMYIRANTGTYQPLFSKGNLNNPGSFFVGGHGNAFRIAARADGEGTSRSSSSGNYELNQWRHVAGIINRTHTLLYVDGILVDNDPHDFVNGTYSSPSIKLGYLSYLSSGTYGVNGSIDEVMIWNRSLSAEEISDLYNMTFYGQIDHTGANHTIPNISLNYYQSAGTNLTFGVTPYNGLVYGNQSNSSTIMVYDVTSPNLTFINLTDLTGQLISVTNPAELGENATLYINLTSDTPIDRVWITIWTTIAEGINRIWQGFLSLLAGTIWSIQIPVNESFGRITNYTIYANDTWGNIVNVSGNITTNQPPHYSNNATNFTSIGFLQTGIFNLTWTDREQLSGFIFSTNASGAWRNNSWTRLSGTVNVSSTVYQINVSQYTRVGWRYYANDSNNVWNATPIYTFVTIDSVEPSISFVASTPSNATRTGNYSVEINVSITEANLSRFIYNWNNTNYELYNDSLVLMYNFDNRSELGEDSTKVVDATKYNNNGNVSGARWISSGKYNGAYNFSGAQNNAINVSGLSMISTGKAFTISSWVYPLSTGSYRTIMGTDGTHRLLIDSNGKMLSQQDGNFFSAASGDVPDGNWTNVIYWNNGTTERWYINGLQSGAEHATVNAEWSSAFRIGQYDLISYPYKGFIDEVRIYNRSLSASEISQLYTFNLQKLTNSSWSFYVNQSTPTTSQYTYQATAYDQASNLNSTGLRYLTVDNTGPILSDQINYTNDRLTYTFSAKSSETSTCTLYGNWTGVWLKNETKSATANIAFNFTSIRFMGESATYKWAVNCSDIYQNIRWSENATFTTATGNGNLKLKSISYTPESPNNTNEVIFNITLENDEVYNFVNVNITLGIADSLFSNITNISTNGQNSLLFRWTAMAGTWPVEATIDINNLIAESNESDNLLSSSITVNRRVAVTITYPMNGSIISRGDGVAGEDPNGIVSTNMTIIARVYDYDNVSYPVRANCTAYINTTKLDTIYTNALGVCEINWSKVGETLGMYDLNVNFTNLPNAHVNAPENSTAINKFRLSRYYTVLEFANDRNGQYYVGDLAILYINITKDGLLYNVTNLTSTPKASDMPNPPLQTHYIEGLTQIGTGQYIDTYIVTAMPYLFWEVEIDDILSAVQPDIAVVGSAVHSDAQINNADAELNLTLYNGTGQTKYNSMIKLYDRNKYLLDSYMINASNPFQTQKVVRGDKYSLLFTENKSSLYLKELNVTVNYTIAPQFTISNSMPNQAKQLSQVIALDSGYNFTEANLTIPFDGVTIDKICYCSAWVTANSTCTGNAWTCNNKENYNYGNNGTHFWIKVNSFSAYAGADIFGPNLTIWDQHDAGMPNATTKYANQLIGFFANYTNNETGALISGASCNISFADINGIMKESASSYWYNRTFSISGTYAYNVTCHKPGLAQLLASNSIVIALSPAPKVNSVRNYTNNRITYTFTANTNETGSCTLYGNWSSSWSKNETKSATANTPFNFTAITFRHDNKNYLWGVNCSYTSSNVGWSTNTSFTVLPNSIPNKPVLVSPDNNTVTASNTTTFIWNNVTDGNNNQVSFTLQIDNNNDFSSIYFQKATYTLNYTLTLAEALPEGIWYWRILSNDTYDTNASDARILENNPSQSVSASLSSNLSGAGVVWTVNSVPQSYLNADANNGILVTNYNVTISASGTTADLYIRADGNLTYATNYIDLNNEMVSFSISNSTVSNASKKSLTTAYINNPIGLNLADGTIVYLKFYLNVSASQGPGTYRNNITFKVVPNGYTP